MKDTKQRIKDILYILLTIGVLFICIKMVLINKSCTNNITVQDTINPYGWDLWEDNCIPLNFSSIYYIDTTNMTIYYDDYDQFDMDNEYEYNSQNINEDYNLMIHISKDNLVELMNRILQWIYFDNDYNKSIKIESMFGIKQIDSTYHIVYLGKL